MKTPLYRQRNISCERRTIDLLKRMTVEEKIAQLTAGFKTALINRDKSGKDQLDEERVIRLYPHGIGRICALPHSYGISEGIKFANKIQEVFVTRTRLGIPVLFDCEALHGCVAPGCTSFPQAIGLASTWNPELLEEIAKVIGKESKARAAAQVLSPVLDIARDVRAGRTEETYGEDPYLVTKMGLAFVRGVQANKVITTPKHFVANFVGDGGRDSHPMHISERLLREIYLPPYEAVIKEAGALSIMSAYHSLDGTPCSANYWLLTQLLRKEWGFKGTVTSDWTAVRYICDLHHVAKDYAEAAELAIKAGLDVECPVTTCFSHLPELVRKGKVSMEILNEAVKRVLYGKFWCGIFDNPYTDEKIALNIINCKEHKQLALHAARQSIVLLKNDGILPLKNNIHKIAVIGPNADTGRLGGYSTTETPVISPLEGIKKIAPAQTKISFAQGCGLTTQDDESLKEAVKAAKNADAVIMVMGNSTPITEGEGHDRCSLDLPGGQQQLILEVTKENPNTVVVLIGGSAVTMQKWLDKVRAVVMAWYPGQEGGTAIAEVLFGKYSPGGKLPITFPKTTGQCPLYYNMKPSGRVYDYNDLRGTQEQFPFGHGLSYTTFKYSNMKVVITGKGKNIRAKISAKITNTGRHAGDEVVQLYIRDVNSKLSRPLKELKGFKRISLKPHQSCSVSFELSWEDLTYLDENLKPTLEEGPIEFMLGSSSSDIRLRWPEIKEKEIKCDDLKGYEVSRLLPPVDDITKAVLPPAATKFVPARQYFVDGMYLTNLCDTHEMKHGLLYLRLNVQMQKAASGLFCYGADGPVKVWLNGKEIDCRPAAANPIVRGEYQIPVSYTHLTLPTIYSV